MKLSSLVALSAAATTAFAQNASTAGVNGGNPPCPDSRYPPCTTIPLTTPDPYATNRVPAPPAVPKWTAFVQSLTDSTKYPWKDLQPRSQSDDGGATGGGPTADGAAWGTAGNQATEVFACPQGKWALSYDDGPVYTDRTLGLLKQNNAVATFFFIGADIVNNQTHAQFVKDTYNAGHLIALHTWTHRQMSTQPTDVIISELMLGLLAVYNIIGKVPRYFRPPYSAIDDRMRFILKAMGLRPVVWNIESLDAGIGTAVPSGLEFSGTLSVENVVAHVKYDFQQKFDARWDYFPGSSNSSSAAGGHTTYDGFISLEHDITEDDLAVASQVIPFAIGTGFKSVYVNECDQVMPNASFYLDDNSVLVQFLKTIQLPLTDADLQPFTGSFPPIPAGGASLISGASPATTSSSSGSSGTGGGSSGSGGSNGGSGATGTASVSAPAASAPVSTKSGAVAGSVASLLAGVFLCLVM